MRMTKKCVSLVLAVLTVLTIMVVGAVPGTTIKTEAASWNGYNYGGGTLYGYQTFLEAFGIDYDVYMKWMDDHDKDSANPNYYLGTPYAHNDHRNPRGDCAGARGAYDTPGVAAMNCTGFVWHVLYKSAVNSGAPSYKINRLSVMGGVPASWNTYGVYRIWFDSVEAAYNSGVLEKGDLMWLYGTSDNHNAIFYGDSPKDFIYWDSAGERNRYCEVHAIGESRGLWVAKVTQPNKIELQMDTASGGSGTKFGTKYCVFNTKAKAQAALDNPDSDAAWDKREGTIVLDSNGHGCFREQSAPSASQLWNNGSPVTNHSYFKSNARRVNSNNTYYAVQWSAAPGVSEDKTIREFKDSGDRTPSGYRIFRCYAPIKVDTPSFSSVKSVYNGIQMKWNTVKGAYKYRIYYRNRNNEWTRMAETSSTSLLDKDVKRNASYTYTIRCIDKYGNLISGFNNTGWKQQYTYQDTPQIADLTSTADGVQLTWNAVDNPVENARTYYRVYYKNSKGGWTKMAQTTDTTYTDEAVAKGTKYTYTVRCVDKDGDFTSNYNATGWKHTYAGVATPQVTEIVSETEGIRLTWDAIEGVKKYRVYGKKSNGSWTRIGETAGTEFFDGIVTAGNSYTYTLRCVNDKGYFVSDYNNTGWTATYTGIDTPQITSAQSEADGIRLTWGAVENAVKYRVYREKTEGGWERIAEVADTEYLDGSAEPGVTYRYTIRCVNDNGGFMSDYDKEGVEAVYDGVALPQITSLESQADGIHLTWDAVEGAAKYRVYTKNAKGGWTRIGETADTQFTDEYVTNNTEYTYTVRCVNSSDNFSSDFSREGWKHTYAGIATPAFKSLESTEGGVLLTWDPVEGAVQYRLFYYGRNGWTRLTTTAGTSFLDDDVEIGTGYTYTIRCLGSHDNYISDYNGDGFHVVFDPFAAPGDNDLPIH